MQTPHEVQSQEHYESIRSSIEENGWQGEPLVKWGDDHLLTGSHRYPAAQDLGMTDSQIPMIDLEEVFAEDGLEFGDLHEIFGAPTVDELVASGLLLELSSEIREKYGIQF